MSQLLGKLSALLEQRLIRVTAPRRLCASSRRSRAYGSECSGSRIHRAWNTTCLTPCCPSRTRQDHPTLFTTSLQLTRAAWKTPFACCRIVLRLRKINARQFFALQHHSPFLPQRSALCNGARAAAGSRTPWPCLPRPFLSLQLLVDPAAQEIDLAVFRCGAQQIVDHIHRLLIFLQLLVAHRAVHIQLHLPRLLRAFRAEEHVRLAQRLLVTVRPRRCSAIAR